MISVPPDLVNRNQKRIRNYYSATTTVSAKDIKNADNPKYNFRKNYKNNLFVVFVTSAPHLQNIDFEFKTKYNVLYVSFESYSMEYAKEYNDLTFKYLNTKYKNTWQSEIRKDVIGLDDYLKKLAAKKVN